jgi:hypothetical protein
MENFKDPELNLLLEPKDFKCADGMEFKDLDHEEYRVYKFDNNVMVRIDNPLKLNISKSGGHRIWDARGVSHYVPSGWVHLYWLVKKGENHFDF